MIVNQSKIEEYIKIIYQLNIHFEVPKKPGVYSFSYKSTLDNNLYKNPNFYYDIAGMFYNYSSIYFS